MQDQPMVEASIIDEDILVIKLHGNLDSSKTDEFEQAVQEHLDQGHSKMIIDCRFLGFISSYGIGVIMAMQARLRKRGGVVKLASVQGLAADVVRMVRLDKVMDIYGDLEFARQSFYPS